MEAADLLQKMFRHSLALTIFWGIYLPGTDIDNISIDIKKS